MRLFPFAYTFTKYHPLLQYTILISSSHAILHIRFPTPPLSKYSYSQNATCIIPSTAKQRKPPKTTNHHPNTDPHPLTQSHKDHQRAHNKKILRLGWGVCLVRVVSLILARYTPWHSISCCFSFPPVIAYYLFSWRCCRRVGIWNAQQMMNFFWSTLPFLLQDDN